MRTYIHTYIHILSFIYIDLEVFLQFFVQNSLLGQKVPTKIYLRTSKFDFFSIFVVCGNHESISTKFLDIQYSLGGFFFNYLNQLLLRRI